MEISRVNEFKDRGAYKVCANCGKVFYVISPELWVYRHDGHLRGEDKVTYLCSWHCLRAHQQAYAKRRDERLEEMRKAATKRRRAKKLKTIDESIVGKTCDECRYFSIGKYGFAECSMKSTPISRIKMACKKFKPLYEEDEDG